MTTNPTLWMYFADAGAVVKTVMLLLMAASVVSWTMIFQRGFFLKKMRESIDEFEEKFWSGIDLVKLHFELDRKTTEPVGLENIFLAGFDEFLQLRKKMEPATSTNMEMIQRAMRVAERREAEKLERHLPFLASVGSISPYVGLFGTVWGIMTAFQALGSADQATIAMVAPGISEALIATAMGLFAAIPAVLAYNRYSNITERLLNTYESFQEEFFNVLVQRQQQGEK